MRNFSIVPVDESNVSAFTDIVKELVGLSSYKAKFDRNFVYSMAHKGMFATNYYLRLAQLSDETHCGLVIGSVTTLLFAQEKMGVEETIYVKEGTPFRASIAKALLAGMEDWMFNTHNVSFIRAGETSDISPVAVDAFFRSQGYKHAGTLYKKERS